MGRGVNGKRTGIEIRSGKIRIVFQYRGQRCRETLDLKATSANLKHAERLRAEIVERIRVGTFTYAEYFPGSPRAEKTAGPAKPTFKEVAQKWLRTLSDKSHSTRGSYELILESFWYPAIGDRSIDDIKRGDILDALARKQWRSMKTRNNHMIPARGVFEYAFLDDLIERDPTDKIKNAKFQSPPPDPFDLEEVETILAKMRQRYDEQIVNYFEFAFFTGMRPSEIIALTWDDIDRRKRIARVHHVRVWGVDKQETKTHRERDVELNSRAMSALQRQMAHTYMRNAKAVFYEPGFDRPWHDDRRQREDYWAPTLKACGIRYREPYQTRHTFATLNLMAGANPMWVAQQMGHVNMKMLLERYSRWIPGADGGAERDKLEVLIQGQRLAK